MSVCDICGEREASVLVHYDELKEDRRRKHKKYYVTAQVYICQKCADLRKWED